MKNEFKIARNRACALLRSSKRRYLKKEFESNRFDTAKTWELANRIRGRTKRLSIDDMIDKSFAPVTQKTIDDFNTFFARTSGADHDSDDATVTLHAHTEASAFLPLISEYELRDYLFSFKERKSPGYDEIRVRDLRRNFETLKHVLLEALNNVIETGSWPAGMKTAIVKPLYKGELTRDIENYRPISILSCIAQLLEKHSLKVMSGFSERFALLSDHQYGFVSERGTQSLVEKFSDSLHAGFDNNMYTCAVFLNVSKAFDSINHEILCSKLYKLGFRGPLFSILKGYLSGRSQVVAFRNRKSNKTFLTAGVPQGSVLSPLLFNLYVNDLPNVISECKIYQYADDTVLMSCDADYHVAVRKLQKDLIFTVDCFFLT